MSLDSSSSYKSSSPPAAQSSYGAPPAAQPSYSPPAAQPSYRPPAAQPSYSPPASSSYQQPSSSGESTDDESADSYGLALSPALNTADPESYNGKRQTFYAGSPATLSSSLGTPDIWEMFNAEWGERIARRRSEN